MKTIISLTIIPRMAIGENDEVIEGKMLDGYWQKERR